MAANRSSPVSPSSRGETAPSTPSSSATAAQETLRGCVEPLAAHPDVRVTVVDNASPGRPARDDRRPPGRRRSARARNGGFSYGCNLGAAARHRAVPAVPQPGRADRRRRARRAGRRRCAPTPAPALVGPRILDDDGALAYSLRRFPRLRSTYAQALFLHRLWPHAAWTRRADPRPAAYERPGTPEWVSGACMLVRRDAYEAARRLRRGLLPLLRGHRPLPARVGCRPRGALRAGRGVRHVGGGSSGAGETQAIAPRAACATRASTWAEAGPRADRRRRARRAVRVAATLLEAGAATRPPRRAPGRARPSAPPEAAAAVRPRG